MQKGQTITMSRKESNRLAVIDQASQRQISQKEASEQLKISDRQIK